ncbi:YdcF family protein [Longispora sp. NPDC051575]|uniref:YdcF family protein n=1 Tax=Longispora sp. NPDC051575 TaxID=3154943 RepID=UPI003445DDC8
MNIKLPREIEADVQTLWDYQDLHQEPQRCDVGIGLGSHDLGVAVYTAELYHRGLFPRIVFTGANAPTTVERFPRGEAVHYREEAIRLGVPPEVILTETRATNTGQNIEFTRDLLRSSGIDVQAVMLISRPYQQRRAYATCKLLWPEVGVTCGSRPLPLAEYIESIGNVDRVVNMLVGDTHRIIEYPKLGFAIPQPMPDDVHAAFERLVGAGFTTRLVRAT